MLTIALMADVLSATLPTGVSLSSTLTSIGSNFGNRFESFIYF